MNNSHLVHRSEQLANLSTGVKALLMMLRRGELRTVLSLEPRPARATPGSNRRLSLSDIDQLVADYRGGIRSVYALADIYGVHRSTVALHLKQRGVRLGRLPMEPSEVERARSLHGDGLSLNEIGRRIGRDPKTVKTAL